MLCKSSQTGYTVEIGNKRCMLHNNNANFFKCRKEERSVIIDKKRDAKTFRGNKAGLKRVNFYSAFGQSRSHRINESKAINNSSLSFHITPGERNTRLGLYRIIYMMRYNSLSRALRPIG